MPVLVDRHVQCIFFLLYHVVEAMLEIMSSLDADERSVVEQRLMLPYTEGSCLPLLHAFGSVLFCIE